MTDLVCRLLAGRRARQRVVAALLENPPISLRLCDSPRAQHFRRLAHKLAPNDDVMPKLASQDASHGLRPRFPMRVAGSSLVVRLGSTRRKPAIASRDNSLVPPGGEGALWRPQMLPRRLPHRRLPGADATQSSGPRWLGDRRSGGRWSSHRSPQSSADKPSTDAVQLASGELVRAHRSAARATGRSARDHRRSPRRFLRAQSGSCRSRRGR